MACYWANFSFTVTFIFLCHKGPAKDMKLGPSMLHPYMFIAMPVVVYRMVFWRGWYLSFHSCKTWSGILTAVLYLTFKKFAYMYANTHKKNTTKINFVYSGNKEFFFFVGIFKLFCIISVLFSKEGHLFHNFTFSLQTTCCFYKPYAIIYIPTQVDEGSDKIYWGLHSPGMLHAICLATFWDNIISLSKHPAFLQCLTLEDITNNIVSWSVS